LIDASNSTHSLCWLSINRVQFFGREDTLQSDLMGNECLQKVVGNLLKLLNASDVSTHDSLLLLKHPEGAENLHIGELLVIEVFEGLREKTLVFLIEEDFAS
jgi:hypothetical protein